MLFGRLKILKICIHAKKENRKRKPQAIFSKGSSKNVCVRKLMARVGPFQRSGYENIGSSQANVIKSNN